MSALKQQSNQRSNFKMSVIRGSRNVINFDKSEDKLNTIITQYHSHYADCGLREQKRIKDLDKNLLVTLIHLLGFQLNAYNRTYQDLKSVEVFKLKKSYNHLSANVSRKKAENDLAKIGVDINKLSEKQLTNVLKKFSGKTVGRHLHHLESLGLLKIDKYGCQNRYLLNPGILSFAPEHHEIAKFLHAEYQLIKESKETNCPTYQNSKRIINQLTSNVEMLITEKVDEDSLQNILKEPKANMEKDLSNENSQKKNSAAAANPKLSPREQKRRDYIKQFAINMWIWMFENLYSGKVGFVAPSQKQIAIEYFENEADKLQNWKQLENFSTQTRKRLTKWQKHVEKIEGFTPLPSKFFDENNLKGYAITKLWLKQDFQKRVWLKENTNIDNCLRDIKHVLNGKSNHVKQLQNGSMKVIKRPLNYQEIIAYINQYTDKVERFCTRNNRTDLLNYYRNKLSELTQAADWSKINEWQPSNVFEKQVTKLERPKMQVKYNKRQPNHKETSPVVPKDKRVTTEQMQKLNSLFNVSGKR